jgi:hypothetical protein
MSWELFRCNTDCDTDPDNCISENMYKSQADAMVAGGFRSAGYASIHMDDCWEQKNPPRDPTTNKLRAEPTRFPSGMKALGDYYHSKNISFAAYTAGTSRAGLLRAQRVSAPPRAHSPPYRHCLDPSRCAESATTCGGYPASANHEALDAKTFAEWGVDYVKVDGCGPADYYAEGYKAMGAGLEASGRPIEYSCSWPAYSGENESTKPFQTYIDDGCNGWRNWNDVQCRWASVSSIIDHWGMYGEALQPWAGPGHWHDMDMLLVGAISLGYDPHGPGIGERCISLIEEQTQMAIWCISSSPLIMGNDMRNISADSKAILFNQNAIAVNQDPLGKMGIRLTGDAPSQVWAKTLTPRAGAAFKAAVGLYNKYAGGQPLPTSDCSAWSKTGGSYYDSPFNIGAFPNGTTLAEAEAACCANDQCAGFSFSLARGGFYRGQPLGAAVSSGAYDGYARPGSVPGSGPAPAQETDIAFKFADIPGWPADAGASAAVTVLDIWTGKTTTVTTGEYTAKGVPVHGTAFITIEV